MKELSYDAKQFIKKNANLIKNKKWVPLFKELGKSNMLHPGEVTDVLLEVGGYSLDEMLQYHDVIPYCLFSGSLINSIKIPSHIEHIEGKAFQGCHELTTIIMPNNIKSIGKDALCYCTNLKSVQLPKDLTKIGDGVFSFCESLQNIDLPVGLTIISSNAFYRCGALSRVEIPDTVTSIEGWAFYHCNSLISINIPVSVTRIENNAFLGCLSLMKAVVNNPNTTFGKGVFSHVSPNFELHGYRGSTTETYANKNGYRFVAID